jgi:hypothetical protein
MRQTVGPPYNIPCDSGIPGNTDPTTLGVELTITDDTTPSDSLTVSLTWSGTFSGTGTMSYTSSGTWAGKIGPIYGDYNDGGQITATVTATDSSNNSTAVTTDQIVVQPCHFIG